MKTKEKIAKNKNIKSVQNLSEKSVMNMRENNKAMLYLYKERIMIDTGDAISKPELSVYRAWKAGSTH